MVIGVNESDEVSCGRKAANVRGDADCNADAETKLTNRTIKKKLNMMSIIIVKELDSLGFGVR